MATAPLQQPIRIGSLNNDCPPIYVGGPDKQTKKYFREAASQSFVAGDLVYIGTNGKVAICTVSSSILNGAVLGIAMQAATGVTDSPVYVLVLRDHDIVEMNVYHGTGASAITAESQLGDIFGVIKVNSKWHVDIENTAEDAATANGTVQVIGFSRKDTIGDTYGRVLVTFLRWSMATDGNPNRRVLQGGR